MYTLTWYSQFLDEITEEPFTLRKASVLWKCYRFQLTVDTHMFKISYTILELTFYMFYLQCWETQWSRLLVLLKDDLRNG